MKVLTVFQPWATLIAIGAKPNEFRGHSYELRNPKVRGARIGIHAASRPLKYGEVIDLHDRLLRSHIKNGADNHPAGTGLIPQVALPFLEKLRASMEGRGDHISVPTSAIVATATLGRAIRADSLFAGLPSGAANARSGDSDRTEHHMYAWPMIEPKAIMPAIPCRGAQGFWNLPADLERELNDH